MGEKEARRPAPQQGVIDVRPQRRAARAGGRGHRPGDRQAAPPGRARPGEHAEQGSRRRADPHPAGQPGQRTPPPTHERDGEPTAGSLSEFVRRRIQHDQQLPQPAEEPRRAIHRFGPGRRVGRRHAGFSLRRIGHRDRRPVRAPDVELSHHGGNTRLEHRPAARPVDRRPERGPRHARRLPLGRARRTADAASRHDRAGRDAGTWERRARVACRRRRTGPGRRCGADLEPGRCGAVRVD